MRVLQISSLITLLIITCSWVNKKELGTSNEKEKTTICRMMLSDVDNKEALNYDLQSISFATSTGYGEKYTNLYFFSLKNV